MQIRARSRAARFLSGGLMFAAVCSVAAPAVAQENPASPAPADESAEAMEDAGLETIIVTARKVEENLQDVPVAVTAFSGDALVRQNAVSVSDLGRFTPSLSFREANSSPQAVQISLRGQVQSDILATLDPSVGTYVDGVYWARAYGINAELLDLASVQVLKGPQGTLFGRNTTGGAILLNSNVPDLDDFSALASGTYGRFDELTGIGIINVPIAIDKFAIRIAAQRSTRDGWVRNTLTGVKYNERDRWNVRGKALWQITDNLSLLGSAEYFDADEDAPYRQLAVPLNAFNDPSVVGLTCGAVACTAAQSPYTTSQNAILNTGVQFTGLPPTAANVPGILTAGRNALNTAIAGQTNNTTSMNVSPISTIRTYTYGGTLSLDTFYGNVKLIGGYRRVRALTTLDIDGSLYPIHTTSGFQRLKQFSLELQTTGKALDDQLDFAAGMFYFHESGFDRSRSVTIPLVNPNTSLFSGDIKNDSLGLYSQATFHFSDRFSATGGVRYSIDDKGLTTRNSNLNRTTNVLACAITGRTVVTLQEIFPDICAITRKDDFDGISYTAGLEFKPSEDSLVYIKTSKGFRSGGQNLRAPNAATFIPYEPEIAYSHEVGLKSQFFDNRIRVNLAAYRTTVEDIQRTTFVTVVLGGVSTNATILGNAGKARFTGLEAEVSAVLVDGLTLSATGALTKPKYVSFADANGLDRRQERFVTVPRRQASLAADYVTDFDWGGLRARVDYSWQSKSATDPYFDADNPQNAAIVAATTEPSRGLLGARVSVNFSDNMFEVSAFGRNLTNNRGVVTGLVVAPIGYANQVRREPRTYGVTGTVRF